MREWLAGKKTYIVAVVGVLAALGGAYFGLLSTDAAVTLFVTSLGLAGLRSGMTTEVARAIIARAADEGERRRSTAPPPPDSRKTSGGSSQP